MLIAGYHYIKIKISLGPTYRTIFGLRVERKERCKNEEVIKFIVNGNFGNNGFYRV